MKAEKILLNEHLKIDVAGIPSAISAGCGLCLRMSKENLATAFNLLTTQKITIQQIYIYDRDEYHKIEPDGSYTNDN